MKLSHAFVFAALGLTVASGARADYCANKDLINLGPTAYDVGVLITGSQPLTWRYDGAAGAIFSNFSFVNAGTNSFLHWQNLNGTDVPILTGDLVHIGWCTKSANNIVDMWFTTKAGGRVPGSVVYETLAHHWHNLVSTGVQFDNAFNASATMVISNVRAAITSTPWPLAQLNRQNSVLAEQLRPVEGGTSIRLERGGRIQLPVGPLGTGAKALYGQTMVVVYEVGASGGGAQTIDYVQFPIEP